MGLKINSKVTDMCSVNYCCNYSVFDFKGVKFTLYVGMVVTSNCHEMFILNP